MNILLTVKQYTRDVLNSYVQDFLNGLKIINRVLLVFEISVLQIYSNLLFLLLVYSI